MHSETASQALEQAKEAMMALSNVFVQDRLTIGTLGSENARYFYSVRDSIVYRSNSLQWHALQLRALRVDLEQNLHSSLEYGMSATTLLYSQRAGLNYLFDDIVFGNVSLLDYIANLVRIVFDGFGKRGNFKWNNAHKSACSNHGPLSASETGRLLKKVHKDWVNSLQAYRSDLIHSHAIPGKASHEWRIERSGLHTSLKVAAPNNIRKLFARMELPNEELDICSAAVLINETTANISTKILSSLITEIRTSSNKPWVRSQDAPPKMFAE